jgi:hypothetical protein
MNYLIFLLNNLALLISLVALMFTLFSFWWMNWRRGKLIIGTPYSYAAVSTGKDKMLFIQFPFVFYNSGAAVQLIQTLRLKLKQGEKSSAILFWNNTLKNLAKDDGHEWVKQFAIEGRSSFESIFVFRRIPGNFIFSPGIVKVVLEGKVNNNSKWQVLSKFDLNTPEDNISTLNSETLLVYDNDPDREYK